VIGCDSGGDPEGGGAGPQVQAQWAGQDSVAPRKSKKVSKIFKISNNKSYVCSY
jgi:hypothetical protein